MTKHWIIKNHDGDFLAGFFANGQPRWQSTNDDPHAISEALVYSSEDLSEVAHPALMKAEVAFSVWPTPGICAACMNESTTKGSMTDTPKRHVIPDPFPETIGVSSMTIWVPEDFRGDAEIIWRYPGKTADSDKQRMTCSTSWLLQGIFHDMSGSRPAGIA